ncbi:tyrosine-type recombinase/integrase [Palleronia caenipelagi]|uniref:Site-specific integrase n=1 Tax=Palleronia caenipelagi TaxID=2489174 RepID=A0A547Q6T4_9RHOB|nr:tyrosine-type recombinase/integrase [Palleronia caenipelagi]TRD22096.1 site-specific integrase [Palleronia caenipelagi]
MPLRPKLRPDSEVWQAHGRVDYNGRPITKYLRLSTGSSTEAGAKDWIAHYEAREIRRYLIGDEAERLTMNEAILLYKAKPAEAERILKIIEALGHKADDFLNMAVVTITPKYLRDLGVELKPNCATDTMWREIVSPIRAIINNAHDLGKCPPIKVKRYSEKERIDQDEFRGKQSRVERTPGDREWLAAFCADADIYNAALANFMFETGARIDQAISLEPDHIDLMNKRVWLKAAKGHPAQWVAISHDMMIQLANLPPKCPANRKTGERMSPRVFGYGSSTGYTKRWRTICKNAGIPYLSAHPAGRHGFYTELRVRQGVDPMSAAKAGRWKDPTLPDRVYAHGEQNEAEIRERVRTGRARSDTLKTIKQLKENRK